MTDSKFILNNQLLSSLSAFAYQRLLPYLEETSLTSGQVVHQSYETITDVYFPQTAIFSLIVTMSDRSTAEISLVGKEGMVGLPTVFGDDLLSTDTIVQIPGKALKLSTKVMRNKFQQDRELQSLLLTYAQVYTAHVSQIAACSSLHNIEQRLARSLLLVHDYTQQEILQLTQKSLSLMLGVRRASVTEAAIALQKQQIIRYSRGKIEILNRSQLENITCECYCKIYSEYKRLLRANLSKQI